MGKRIIIYTIIFIICIICLGIGIYAQFFYKYGQEDVFLTGMVSQETVSEEMYQDLKNDFDTIFNNRVNENADVDTLIIEDETKDAVYTKQTIEETAPGRYDININIPYLNLALDGVDKINEEINSIFGTKYQEIISNSNVYTIYNVNYASYINDNIISIVIKATLKEGQNSQRVIIKTYNYDIQKEAVASLEELVNLKGLKLENVQKKIRNEIEKVYNENLAFEKAGYTVYQRDKQSSIYEINNTDTFFLGINKYLYILYPYGNTNFTSEIDIVLF